MQLNTDIDKIAEQMMDILVSPNMVSTDYKGCDNMTVIIIDFRKQTRKNNEDEEMKAN